MNLRASVHPFAALPTSHSKPPARDEIVLIGPAGAGKTTVAPFIGARLNTPVTSVDPMRWTYFAEIGYDAEYGKALRASNLHDLAAYWKAFEAHTVERVFDDYHNCIFEFGASYTVQDDPVLWERVKTAFEPFHNVVLMLPDPDPDQALRITIERLEAEAAANGDTMRPELVELNRHFITSPCNAELANFTVFTGGKSPDDIALEIIEATQVVAPSTT